jgi:hypothetical protein
MRETYTVTLNRDPRMTVADMKDYIRDALGSWGGQYEPPGAENGWWNGEGDPRFATQEPITVRRVKK